MIAPFIPFHIQQKPSAQQAQRQKTALPTQVSTRTSTQARKQSSKAVLQPSATTFISPQIYAGLYFGARQPSTRTLVSPALKKELKQREKTGDTTLRLDIDAFIEKHPELELTTDHKRRTASEVAQALGFDIKPLTNLEKAKTALRQLRKKLEQENRFDDYVLKLPEFLEDNPQLKLSPRYAELHLPKIAKDIGFRRTPKSALEKATTQLEILKAKLEEKKQFKTYQLNPLTFADDYPKLKLNDPHGRKMIRKAAKALGFTLISHTESLQNAANKRWEQPGAAAYQSKKSTEYWEQNPEQRQANSEQATAMWQDPTLRQQIQEKMTTYHAQPSVQLRKSLQGKANWEKPEYREKMTLIARNNPFWQETDTASQLSFALSKTFEEITQGNTHVSGSDFAKISRKPLFKDTMSQTMRRQWTAFKKGNRNQK